jgi:hypothetical protein
MDSECATIFSTRFADWRRKMMETPGVRIFARETGIAEHQWRGKFWARWGDALIEAGYQPNKWTGRLDSKEFLTGVIAACRHFGRLPTYDEMDIYRTSAPSVPKSPTAIFWYALRPDCRTFEPRAGRRDVRRYRRYVANHTLGRSYNASDADKIARRFCLPHQVRRFP